MHGKHDEVTATQADKHGHLGINIWFKKDGSVEIDMKECIRNMLQEFPVKFKTEGKCAFPASVMMIGDDTSGKLDKHRSELFHRFVAMVLFVCKRPRLDPQPNLATLCARTKAPNETDWGKPVQMMKFINATKDDVLTLSAGKGMMNFSWCVDATFAVHQTAKATAVW